MTEYLRYAETHLTVADKPTAQAKYTNTVELSTNLYELDDPKNSNVTAYSYKVQLSDYLQHGEHGVGDYCELEKGRNLFAAVEALPKKIEGFTKHDLFCDITRQKLYTLKPIPKSEHDENFWVHHQLQLDPPQNLSILRDFGEPFRLCVRDLGNKVAIPNEYDATLEAFVNTAVSHARPAKKDRYYMMEGYCYERKGSSLASEKGQELLVGAKCAVERVEGSNGSHSAAFAVDVHCNWFYKRQSLLSYCMENTPFDEKGVPTDLVDFERLSRSLRGITVFVSYYKVKELYTLVTISNINPSTFKHRQRGPTLKYPNGVMATVIRDDGRDTRPLYFPLELLELPSNQRGSSKDKRIQYSDVDKEGIIKGMAIDFHNQVVKAKLGFDMSLNPLEVRAGVLKLPELHYGSTVVRVDPTNAEWDVDKSVKFIRPADVSGLNWAVLIVPDEYPTMKHEVRGQEFADIIREQAIMRGLDLPEAKLHVVHNGKQEIERFFCTTAVEFVVFVMSKSLKYHEYTKILEREYQVNTQTVTLENAFSVVNEPTCVESKKIVEHSIMKMNIKLGGINYEPIYRNRRIYEPRTTLFVGLTLKNCEVPEKMKSDNRFGGPCPAIVGYAASIGPSQFLGDFHYQYNTSDNVIKPIDKIIKSIYSRVISATKGNHPREIVIYRTLKEQEYKKVMEKEIPAIQQAISDSYVGMGRHLIYIAVTEDHSIRFFPKAYEEDALERETLLPGTVIDRTVVSSSLKQFYLSACSTPVGTRRVPRFSVLVDTTNSSVEKLERMTLDMCFAHQTSTQALRVPAPIKMAQDYVKRGELLAKTAIKKEQREAVITVSNLNAALQISNAANLKDKRITA
uniref:Piwi domain-containing protein n=1 Tax=Steinernema glaseri TaxID=37863 RepID=A0A1I7Y474_9BILA